MTNKKITERENILNKENSARVKVYQQLDGQKFVLGCMIMRIIEDDPSRIPQVLSDIDKYITRKADIKRLESFKREISNKLE